VGLVEASGAPIMGFNVRANASCPQIRRTKKGVEIRYYSVIYDLGGRCEKGREPSAEAMKSERIHRYAQSRKSSKCRETAKVALSCSESIGPPVLQVWRAT